MAEVNARDAKLIQYLNEAYGKEKQLETALQAHIAMTTRPPYKKRLQEHLKETKGHARELQRRIKALGGKADAGPEVPGPEVAERAAAAVQNVANRAAALAQGPLHAVRGTSEPEKMLKNARDEYMHEAHEIAQYTSIETLATAVGDRETAQLAKQIKRDEERMAKFLERLIPQLTKAVATAEIPAAERRTASSSRRRSASSRSRSTASSRSTSARSRSGSGTRSRSGSSSRSSASRSGSSRSSSGRSSPSRSGSSSSRSTSARSGSSRSGSSRSSGSGSGSSRSSGSRSSSNGRSSSSSRSRSGSRS
ncbi:MAG: ferritin-like domain-containing protein [Thermoleophilaceae bacterium]